MSIDSHDPNMDEYDYVCSASWPLDTKQPDSDLNILCCFCQKLLRLRWVNKTNVDALVTVPGNKATNVLLQNHCTTNTPTNNISDDTKEQGSWVEEWRGREERTNSAKARQVHGIIYGFFARSKLLIRLEYTYRILPVLAAASSN